MCGGFLRGPVLSGRPTWSRRSATAPDTGEEPTHLPKVSDIEEVEGVKQLAVSESKLIMADFQEGANVLQAQELEERREER